MSFLFTPAFSFMTGRRVWDGTANYLILAGGGGGGGIIAGGGGAGGYRTSWGTGADGSGGYSGGNSSLETALTLSKGTAYSITVGQGGEGGFGWNSAASDANPHQGRDTSISGADITTITSDGGGGGNAYNHNTGAIKDGGSAGGGSAVGNSSGTPTTGQGFSGGISGDTNAAGGGGGGAGQAGGNSNAGGSNTLAGTGGDGLASTITGTSVVRGGGGSGGARGAAGQYLGDYSTTPIPGGDGGGGVGGILNGRVPWVASGTDNASDGRAGYGGGGGGGAYTGLNASAINAGNGGSGIAIFRLPNTLSYSASQLASDVSSLTNCTASYLNTKVYTDDTNYSNVTLLLDGNGTNNQTTFTDLSTVPTPLTTFGNAHVDTTVKKFGSGSIEFDGNGDYLRTDDFGLTSGDFTIEAWVRLKAMPTSDSWPAAFNSWMVIVGVGTFNLGDGWQFRIGQTQLAFGTNADSTAVTGTHGMSTGTWYHLAVTRSGNVYTVYVDGSIVGSAAYTAQQPGSGAYGWVGAETGQGAYLNGYIDDLRITKGVARYTSNFTPPTSALTNTVSSGTVALRLNGDGNSGDTTFTDESSSSHTITTNGDTQVFAPKYGTGSIDLDGTGDYLEVDFQSNIGVSGDPFTVECWVYFDTLNDDGVINLTQGGFGQGGNSLAIGYYNSQWRFYDDNTSTATGVTPGPSTGQWYHTAIVFDGTDLVFYIDGVARLTRSNHASNMPAGGYPTVIFGGYFGAGYELDGKIDDIRVTKGGALYSGSFTPPTSALTNTVSSGTVVLRLNGDGTSGDTTFIDQSNASPTIAVNGNTQVFGPKYGTGSIEFDGAGDYLSISDSEDFNMGSGDFTAECWAYFNSLSTTEPFIMGQWSGDINAGTLNWAIMLSTNTGYVRFITSSNGNGVLFDLSTSTTSFSLSTNTWYHIAAVRNGSSFKIFVDGVERASTTNTSTLFNATNAFTIGAESNGQQQAINGYLDDIRVTKGAALYPDTGRIGQLVPPTSALPNRETSTGGDHVISFTVATEDPYDGATANDGSCVWTIS